MSVFGERLRTLRKNKKLSIDELTKQLNDNYDTTISKSMISRYENGQSDPKMENVRVIADYFKVSADYLVGITKEEKQSRNDLPELTAKDERDIQKELQNMIDNLSTDSGYAAFDGKAIDELSQEDRELLIASLENTLRLTKRLAKQKFTPKKYRN